MIYLILINILIVLFCFVSGCRAHKKNVTQFRTAKLIGQFIAAMSPALVIALFSTGFYFFYHPEKHQNEESLPNAIVHRLAGPKHASDDQLMMVRLNSEYKRKNPNDPRPNCFICAHERYEQTTLPGLMEDKNPDEVETDFIVKKYLEQAKIDGYKIYSKIFFDISKSKHFNKPLFIVNVGQKAKVPPELLLPKVYVLLDQSKGDWGEIVLNKSDILLKYASRNSTSDIVVNIPIPEELLERDIISLRLDVELNGWNLDKIQLGDKVCRGTPFVMTFDNRFYKYIDAKVRFELAFRSKLGHHDLHVANIIPTMAGNNGGKPGNEVLLVVDNELVKSLSVSSDAEEEFGTWISTNGYQDRKYFVYKFEKDVSAYDDKKHLLGPIIFRFEESFEDSLAASF